MSKDCVLHKAE
jgi:hypothetical protein